MRFFTYIKRKRIKILWVLSILFITYLTLFFKSESYSPPTFEHLDKVAHFSMFFVLSLLGGIHIIKTRYNKFFVWQMLNFISVSVLGGLIEFIQPYFGRDCSAADFYANSAGALFGVLLSKLIYVNIIRRILDRNKK